MYMESRRRSTCHEHPRSRVRLARYSLGLGSPGSESLMLARSKKFTASFAISFQALRHWDSPRRKKVTIPQNHVIAREFVRNCLCGSSGYFMKGDVIGSANVEIQGNARGSESGKKTTQGLAFDTMLGEFEYRMHLDQLYKSSGSCWLTPSEIFAPWYGRSERQKQPKHCIKLS
jgi:hypothetical protein